jgi:hypothetical protein
MKLIKLLCSLVLFSVSAVANFNLEESITYQTGLNKPNAKLEINNMICLVCLSNI